MRLVCKKRGFYGWIGCAGNGAVVHEVKRRGIMMVWISRKRWSLCIELICRKRYSLCIEVICRKRWSLCIELICR